MRNDKEIMLLTTLSVNACVKIEEAVGSLSFS